jgi:UDP-3-O-[3-hydroxymyristoyl] glucosamine N-acyltransferase
MSWTLSTLARRYGLTLQGEDREILGCNSLAEAGPSELSFLANPKYLKQLETTRAGAVILEPRFSDRYPSCLLSQNPYFDFARVAKLFAAREGYFEGRSEQAFIHPEAQVAEDVTIYPLVSIGPRTVIEAGCVLFSGVYVAEDCRIGPGCVLYPNVVLMSRTELGRRVMLHAGVVLGSDGFGFASDQEQGLKKIPQVGKVVIEDEVDIGANTTIDRATMGETRIKKGTKIDNQVQIGHNVEVGQGSILVAQAGVAGSSKLGSSVILAGQVGVSGHLHIGDRAKVGAKSGINRNLQPDAEVMGYPAMEHRKFLRYAALQSRMPELYQRIKALEAEMEQIKSSLRGGGEEL